MPRERDVVGGETPDMGGADKVSLGIVFWGAWPFRGVEVLVLGAWIGAGGGAVVVRPAELLQPDGAPAGWQGGPGAEPAFSRQRARTVVAVPRGPSRVEAGVEWPPTS